MAVQTLGINITTNASQALPGINATTAGLNGLGAAGQTAASGISLLAPPLSQSQQLLQGFVSQARRGELSYERVGQAASGAGRAIVVINQDLQRSIQAFGGLAPVSQSAIRGFNSLRGAVEGGGYGLDRFNVTANGTTRALTRTTPPVNRAQYALTNLGRVASDAPFGFIAIQNNLDPLISSFGLLFSTGQGLTGGFKALGSALTGPAGIGLAFTTISSIATVLIQKYGSLYEAYRQLSNETGSLADRQYKYSQAIAAAQKEFVGAVSSVTELRNSIELAKNGFIDKDEVVKKYNDTIGKTTGSVKTLAEAESQLQKNADAYIKFTLLKAAAQESLTEAAKAAFKAEQARRKSDEESVDYLFSGLTNSKDTGVTKIYKQNAKRNRDTIAAEAEKDQSLFEEIAKGLQEEAAKIAKAYNFNFYDSSDSSKKTESQVDKQKKIIESLTSTLKSLDAQFFATGGSLADLTNNKISAFRSAIGSLAEIDILPGSEIVDGLRARIQQLQDVVNGQKATIKIPINITPLPTATNTSAVKGVIQGYNDVFQPQLNEFTKNLNKQIQDATVSGISAVSAAVGAAFAGGGFSGILSSFVGAIADFGSALGKQLIAQGIAIEAFKKSLQSLQGIPAIIAGGALIAVSAGFRTLASKGVASFATGGGVVGGPQMAMIGDNPGREEYVIPSEVLDKMGGGGGTIMHRFSVNEFIIWLDRGRRNR